MASPGDKDQFKRLQKSTGDFTANIVKPPPPLPADVKRRFPSLVNWEENLQHWAKETLGRSIRGGS